MENNQSLPKFSITALSIRGIGPYIDGQTLELRPLTVLCGKNGCGKSTWIKVLNFLKESASKNGFPFVVSSPEFETGYPAFRHPLTNAFLASYAQVYEYSKETKKTTIVNNDRPDDIVERLNKPEEELEYGTFGTIGITIKNHAPTVRKQLDIDPTDDSDPILHSLFLLGHFLFSSPEIKIQLSHHLLTPYGNGQINLFIDGVKVLTAKGDQSGYRVKITKNPAHDVGANDAVETSIAFGEGGLEVELTTESSPVLLSMLLLLFYPVELALENHSNLSAMRPPLTTKEIGVFDERLNKLITEVNADSLNSLSESDRMFLKQVLRGDVTATGQLSHTIMKYFRLHQFTLSGKYPESITRGDTWVRESNDNPDQCCIPFFVYMSYWVKKLLGYYHDGGINNNTPNDDLGNLWCAAVGPHGYIEDQDEDVNREHLANQYSEGLDRREDLKVYFDEKVQQIGSDLNLSEHSKNIQLFLARPSSVSSGELLNDENFTSIHPSCRGAAVGPWFPVEAHSTGYHQVLPIVVQAGMKRQNELLSIENPEVHLHPALQGELMGFLVGEANAGKQILIETHSDVMIYRLQGDIMKEMISQNKAVIYFSSLKEVAENSVYGVEIPTTSIIEKVEVGIDGSFSNWPDGFLDQSEKEVVRMLSALPDVENPWRDDEYE